MKIKRDINGDYDVTLSKEELSHAFEKREYLINLMYVIVKNTYGKELADEMFKGFT